ncbi:hypothetical protein HQ535_10735 [bacterium]|nr:hypothetical protein [bacterium]
MERDRRGSRRCGGDVGVAGVYYDWGNEDLKVAASNAPACFGGDEIIMVVDSINGEGEHTSIAINAAGNPVIYYYAADQGALKVAVIG